MLSANLNTHCEGEGNPIATEQIRLTCPVADSQILSHFCPLLCSLFFPAPSNLLGLSLSTYSFTPSSRLRPRPCKEPWILSWSSLKPQFAKKTYDSSLHYGVTCILHKMTGNEMANYCFSCSISSHWNITPFRVLSHRMAHASLPCHARPYKHGRKSQVQVVLQWVWPLASSSIALFQEVQNFLCNVVLVKK